VPSRRALLAGLGVAATSLAGCVTGLTDTASTGRAVALSPDRLTLDWGTGDGFGGQAAEFAQRYDDYAVWGLDGSPTLGEGVFYEGAWVASWDIPDVHGGRPFARADAAAIVFSLGERRRVWLWCGADAHRSGDRLGRTNVARVRVSAEPGPGWELTAAAPRTPTREGPVTVSLDEREPAAQAPLESGGLAADTFDPGPDGAVEVAWQGVSGRPRAAHAVVEFAPTDGDGPFAPPVSFGVWAARGVL
jgi:hypothetical protein